MKLSDTSKLSQLLTKRRRLVCVLDEIVHGSEVEARVGGWDIEIDEALAESLKQGAEQACERDLAEVERQIEALGIVLDVPRLAYVYAHNDCDCEECCSARGDDLEDHA